MSVARHRVCARPRLLEVVISVAAVLVVTVLALTALAVAVPAHAHHGGGASDQAVTLEFSGTITEMRFSNPHVVLFFDVTQNGATENWSGWLAAPSTLARAGWTRRTLEPGDRITVEGRASRVGSRFMQIRKLVDADGRDLPLSAR
jgi:hypothetical protein